MGALTPSCCHLLSVLSCHLAVTFHLLGTEQKHSAGTLQEGGGSDFQCYMEKKETVYMV